MGGDKGSETGNEGERKRLHLELVFLVPFEKE